MRCVHIVWWLFLQPDFYVTHSTAAWMELSNKPERDICTPDYAYLPKLHTTN